MMVEQEQALVKVMQTFDQQLATLEEVTKHQKESIPLART